jgi:hypothetical protein
VVGICAATVLGRHRCRRRQEQKTKNGDERIFHNIKDYKYSWFNQAHILTSGVLLSCLGMPTPSCKKSGPKTPLFAFAFDLAPELEYSSC